MSCGLRLRLGMLGLLCTAFGLRVYQLDAHGFWYDEAFTSWIVAKDWAGILEFARAPKLEHPPFYYFMLHGWTLAAGNSEFALRYFSVFFSVLAAALLYRFARRWFGAVLANWSLVLACFSPFLIVYAQEARMYTLVLAVTILALDAFLRWLDGDQHAWKTYVFFTLLSMGIHYYAALLLLVENLYLLPRAMRYVRQAEGFRYATIQRRRIRATGRQAVGTLWNALSARWLMWNAFLLGLAVLVFVLATGPRETFLLVFSHPLFAGRNAEELSQVLVDLFIGGVVLRPLSVADLLWSAVLVGVVGLGTVCWSVLTRKVNHALLVLWLVIVPPLAAAAVPLIYTARYLFAIVPGLILLSAAALAMLQNHRRVVVLLIAAMLVSSMYGIGFNYGFAKSTYREMAAIATSQARPLDGVVLEGTSQWPFVFYYLGDRLAQAYIPGDPEHAELADIDSAMRAMQTSHPRLWVLSEQAGIVDPGNNVARWLSLNAYPISRTWFNNSDAVSLYDTGHSLSPPLVRNIQFGDWLVLEQSALSAPLAAAGDGIALELHWHAVKPIPQPLQLLITLRLYDSNGNIVQERVTKPCDGFCPIDNWIPGESVSDRHGLLVPPALPPGEYSLRLEVYSPRQGQSLQLRSSQVPAGSSLELSRISVRDRAASGQ